VQARHQIRLAAAQSELLRELAGLGAAVAFIGLITDGRRRKSRMRFAACDPTTARKKPL